MFAEPITKAHTAACLHGNTRLEPSHFTNGDRAGILKAPSTRTAFGRPCEQLGRGPRHRRRSAAYRNGAEDREQRPVAGALRPRTAAPPGSGRRRDHGRTSSRGPASACHAIVGLGPGDADPRPPGPSAGRGASRCLFRRGLCAGRAVRPDQRRAGPAHCLLPRARHGSGWRAYGWGPRGLPARLLRRPGTRARTHARLGARPDARTRRLGLLRAQRPTEPRQGRHRRATRHGNHRARGACRRGIRARLRRHRRRQRPDRPVDRIRQPRARHRNRQCPGVAGQLRRHGLGPPGAAHADPHHRERGADQADHGRPRDRLGDPGRSPRRHHEPGRHPRQRLAPRDHGEQSRPT